MSYEPRELPWPHLDSGSLARLRSLPIWDHALQAETNAGKMVTGFAATVADPTIREAIELQGFEEERHGRMIATIMRALRPRRLQGRPAVAPADRSRVHPLRLSRMPGLVHRDSAGSGSRAKTEFMPQEH